MILTNRGHLAFKQLGDIQLLPMTIHMNESFMENILSFAEVAKIVGVHIKMDTSKKRVINVHIKGRKIFISKHVQRYLYTQILVKIL